MTQNFSYIENPLTRPLKHLFNNKGCSQGIFDHFSKSCNTKNIFYKVFP